MRREARRLFTVAEPFQELALALGALALLGALGKRYGLAAHLARLEAFELRAQPLRDVGSLAEDVPALAGIRAEIVELVASGDAVPVQLVDAAPHHALDVRHFLAVDAVVVVRLAEE